MGRDAGRAGFFRPSTGSRRTSFSRWTSPGDERSFGRYMAWARLFIGTNRVPLTISGGLALAAMMLPPSLAPCHQAPTLRGRSTINYAMQTTSHGSGDAPRQCTKDDASTRSDVQLA